MEKTSLTIFDTLCSFINNTLPAILLAMFGGVISVLNTKNKEFTWRWFLTGVLTAGFVGMIMDSFLCAYDISPHIRTAVISISGYSSNDLLQVLRDKLIERVKNYGDKPQGN